MTISGERTEQLDIFCRITGFTSDSVLSRSPSIYDLCRQSISWYFQLKLIDSR